LQPRFSENVGDRWRALESSSHERALKKMTHYGRVLLEYPKGSKKERKIDGGLARSPSARG
jgi:hypothetical protein